MSLFPRIIAHRGAPRAAPENTLSSFRQAARDGARWVEFDVALTADGRPVVFHDDALDRTTDGAGLLNDTPFEILRNLDAGSWFTPMFAGELVPTLEEALDLFAALGLGFNMEIKPAAGRELETAAVALATLEQCWSAELPVPLISSFSRTAVGVAKDLRPDLPRGLLFDHLPDDWRAVAGTLDVTTLGANHRHLSAPDVAAMTGTGRKVMAYTVNDGDRAATLFDWGVAAVFSDIAGQLLARFAEN